MPKYSHKSLDVLNTCCEELQLLFTEVIKDFDCTLVCGHRTKSEQNRLFEMEPPRTKVRWPNGKHNKLPSDAIDAIPYINGAGSWDSIDCVYFAGQVNGIFARLKREGLIADNVHLRNGADWDRDGDVYEPGKLKDPYHFEIVRM